MHLRVISLFSLLLAIVIGSAAIAADKWVTYEGKDGPGKGKHIVLISGDEEYRSEVQYTFVLKDLDEIIKLSENKELVANVARTISDSNHRSRIGLAAPVNSSMASGS